MLRMHSRRLRFLAVISVLIGLVSLGLAAPATAQEPFTVVASGLDNPRGLAFGLEGALYIAEAGRGGSGPCVSGPEGDEVCYGATGAITRVWLGKQQRIVTGLPSIADPDGGSAGGPNDVAPIAGGFTTVVIGLGASPEARDQLGPGGQIFGHLAWTFPGGAWHIGPDVAGYEAVANPDGGVLDSNPYAILGGPVEHVVVDAGGNDLLRQDALGRFTTLAVFPSQMVEAPPFLGLPPGTQIPVEAVPNSVVRGPDGAYYVGELTGFPFLTGLARIWRVVPGQEPQVYATGFTNVIDLAFAPDGNLYVLEIAANGLLSGDPTGALIRVAPDGSRSTVASDGLVTPTGLAVGPDGALYVSNFGVMAGQGQVVRINP